MQKPRDDGAEQRSCSLLHAPPRLLPELPDVGPRKLGPAPGGRWWPGVHVPPAGVIRTGDPGDPRNDARPGFAENTNRQFCESPFSSTSSHPFWAWSRNVRLLSPRTPRPVPETVLPVPEFRWPAVTCRRPPARAPIRLCSPELVTVHPKAPSFPKRNLVGLDFAGDASAFQNGQCAVSWRRYIGGYRQGQLAFESSRTRVYISKNTHRCAQYTLHIHRLQEKNKRLPCNMCYRATCLQNGSSRSGVGGTPGVTKAKPRCAMVFFPPRGPCRRRLS